MQNLDSLSLLYFYNENFNFINGAMVQKIQLPSRYEIILNIRNLSCNKQENKKLYININPKYPHICFINNETQLKRNIEIPKNPPMFCMQLRKYLSGSKIKDFKIVKYERILELYFDYFDEIGSLSKLCLALEFMGKHSNIILYNTHSKIILGSIHNISQEKSSIREIYGGIKYIYPPLKNKLDILNVSYSTFYEIAKSNNIKDISDNFYYFSQGMLSTLNKNDKKALFCNLQNLQNLNEKKLICSYWNSNSDSINDSIDNYFSNIMFDEILQNIKSKLKKYLTNDIKKLKNIIKIIPDTKKAQNYKLYADLIMSYLYNIQPKQKELIVDNIKIELDENISPSDNAQKYYSLYKKALTTQKYQLERYQNAQEKCTYLESIIFNIDNSSTYQELNEIKNELIDLKYITNETKEKIEPKIQKIIYKNFEIYIGKNNKQNDYLVSKIASAEDLWFHGLNFPSAHIILKIPNDKKPPEAEILEFCAKLTKQNSKAKNSGKTSIIYTKRKNLKKPPNTYLGYVTYKNESEIVI